MKRKQNSDDCDQESQKYEARVAHNANALLGYFDSMAFASDSDDVQPTLRHVLEIERTPLFCSMASLIVEVYYRQRASKCTRDRTPYKQRHQNATMLSYKSRIAHALAHGSGLASDSDSSSSSDDDENDNNDNHTGATTTDDDVDSGGGDGGGGDVAEQRKNRDLMLSCDPQVIGTRHLGRASQWRLCDDADRLCIGRLRQFATWWFTNFAFAMLSVRYRDELIAYTLPIENRVRAVCGFNTLVPWCMNLESELTIQDAATNAPSDDQAQAAHAYASCRFVRDGIISRQTALFAGFVCINAMHSADTCLPPLPPQTAAVRRSIVHCGVLQHPARQDDASIALHYNAERAIRIGNLALHFLIAMHRHTVPELQKHDRSIIQATMNWLREQILNRLRQQAPAAPTSGGNCVKGFLSQLMDVLDETLAATAEAATAS